MSTCPECRAEVAAGSRFCGECGAPLVSMPKGHAATPRNVVPSASAAATVITTTTSQASPDSLFTPGAIVASRYRIVACLGKGGMGEVYRADDLTLGQPVALKFLPPAVADNPRWLERFRNEVRTARQVAHPGVCRVHDLGEVPAPDTLAGAQHFLTMEYIDGEDLASLLRRIGRLPRDKAVQVARQLCAGLAAAHSAGVLHRDLKPANVMIDGRGNAKITDFGIAGLSGQIQGGDVRSGTPAYMAPEQLAGKGVTERSDIYSLGLVLYELFTGRRAYDEETVTAASASRTRSHPSRPSSLIEDMDPGVERVIMRCLAEDPAERPSSALGVAAALPGGDPLRAALEAGETPSPELVAAAGAEGKLSPLIATGLLVFIVAGIVGFVFLSKTTLLSSYLPMPRPADVLADRAREALRTLGYADAPRDWGGDFFTKFGYVGHIQSTEESPDRWEALRAGRPAVLRYWYRSGPANLVPLNYQRLLSQTDPPLETPGMALVELDSLGQLHSFRVVPPGAEPGKAADAPAAEAPLPRGVDWSAAFALSHLDPKVFEPVTPTQTPPDYADARMAWEGPLPETPSIRAHVEAASFSGKPTWFRVFMPWELQKEEESNRSPAHVVLMVIQALVFSGVVFAAWLAHRNYRSGRGDRAGAARLAVGFAVLSMIAWALSTHFTRDLVGQWVAILLGVARALLRGVLAWAFYMALEPFVRRRRPGLIVSWTRLLAGRWRDPLVGRHALIAVGVGVLASLVIRALPIFHSWITGSLPQPNTFEPRMLAGVGGAAAVCLEDIITAPINGMLIFFLVIALGSAVRWRTLRLVVLAIIMASVFMLDPDGSSSALAAAAALAIGIGVALWLNTIGLFGFVVSVLTAGLLLSTPLTTDLGAWHARGMLVALGVVAVLTYWAFTSSTGFGAPEARRPRPQPA